MSPEQSPSKAPMTWRPASTQIRSDKLAWNIWSTCEPLPMGLVPFYLDIQIASMRHDVVEDTKATLDELRPAGVSERSLAAIESVSFNLHPGLTYAQAIDHITSSRDVTMVKKPMTPVARRRK